MKWEQLLDEQMANNYNDQIQTDIECPECGRKIYLDNTIILTTYPCKYKYWCSCGWTGTAHIKWSKDMRNEEEENE